MINTNFKIVREMTFSGEDLELLAQLCAKAQDNIKALPSSDIAHDKKLLMIVHNIRVFMEQSDRDLTA